MYRLIYESTKEVLNDEIFQTYTQAENAIVENIKHFAKHVSECVHCDGDYKDLKAYIEMLDDAIDVIVDNIDE
jgi:hypothetical protein